MNRPKQKEMFIILFCLLVGFILRFYAFDQKSLWIDEIHTFNDSRDDIKGQLNFYIKNPSYLHPPLFFVLTHQLYPFTKPERDLRIIPLIFGTLSVPLLYLLARSFSPSIALACALSLAFMTYHISLSQDGRSYSMLMSLGMTGLYFFMRYLITLKRRFLILVALFFSILFYTSYSSIPFIVLSQILWFYRPSEEAKKPTLRSFFILNGLILLFCLPWILIIGFNYKGQTIMDPLHTESPGSFEYILYGILNDWVPHNPLMIVSVLLLIFFPIFLKYKKNALVLLAVFILPIVGLYLFCKLLHVTHFVTSRYFINFLPLFFITLFLSIEAIEIRFAKLKGFLRLKFLLVILLIASNLIILPLYYRSEKQDFRGLVTYLKGHLREGDKLFVGNVGYDIGILHYFQTYPATRHHIVSYWKISDKEIEFRMPFIYREQMFTMFHSGSCCVQYVAGGNRLWIIVGKSRAKRIKKESPAALKGYFDGSFLNFNRFPTDASMYLFLWDPQAPREKGIDMPIE